MWSSILKKLPTPDNVESFLLSDDGVSHIEQEAEKNKKGIKAVINTTKELSDGKGINEGWTDEQRKTIISNAKKVHEMLSTMLREMKSNTQPAKIKGTIAERLDSILESEDMDAFKELLGEGRLRSSPNEKEKIKAFTDKKDEVINFIEGKEDEFYWVDSRNRIYETIDKPPEYVKGEVTEGSHPDFPTWYILKMPDRVSLEDYRKFLSWFKKGKMAKRNAYKSKGKLEVAPLVKIYNLLTSQKGMDAVAAQERKNYTVSVETGEDAINYMKLLTKRGWNKSSMFMPTPEIQTKAAINSARKRLMMPQGKVVLTAPLKAILVNQNMDINSIMEEGVKQTKETLVPNFVRLVLTGQEEFDYEDAGISLEVMDELKSKFQGTRRSRQMEMPKFLRQISRLGGREKEAIDKIKGYYTNKQNLFTQSEVDKINELKSNIEDMSIGGLISSIKELYGEELPRASANTLFNILDDADEQDKNVFTKIGDFYKLNITESNKKKADLLIRDFRNLRSSSESVSASSDSAWDIIEEEYNEEYDTTSGISSIDIFHTLVLLDWYYADTGLHDSVQDWKNPDDYEEDDIQFEEVVETAKENYKDIVDGFIEAVRLKVEDIIKSPLKYQDELVYTEFRRDDEGRKTGQTNTKSSLMFRDLEEAGVVEVSR